MTDITNPRLIYLKGFLFLGLGTMAAVLLLLESTRIKTAILLVVTIWGFCRFYYFAFYVIEHYVDSNYRFAGLWSFCMYILRKRR
jgi:hypothetical protein